MTKFANYYGFISDDATDFLDHYYDDFLDEIKQGDTDAYQMLDYDGKLHEHCDQYIDLREAVDILEQSNNVETDSGLWEGLDPLEAVSAMGFWTYKSDLTQEVVEQFKQRLEESAEELERELEPLKNKMTDFENKVEEIEDILADLDAEEDEEDIEKYEQDLEDLRQDIDGLEEKIAELEQEIEYIEDAITEL